MTVAATGPAGFARATYDHNADCHLRGTYSPCWVRFDGEKAHIIPIDRSGDWSGLYLIRHRSFVR